MKTHFKITNTKPMGLFDRAIEKRVEKLNSGKFFQSLTQIIDWQAIEKELSKITKRGQKERGQKAHNPLLLFKMSLISIWYQLSDERTEDMVGDSFSFMNFCGLSLEDVVPDHSTLSRFRTELCQKKAYDRLLRKINSQLKQKGLIVTNGEAKVDASLTDSPFHPKGKLTFEMAVDRKEDERSEATEQDEKLYHEVKAIEQPTCDAQARWVKKRGKSIFGYKKHIATDQRGLILGLHSTTANEHDSKGLSPLMDKVPKDERKKVFADKGYRSKANVEMLSSKGSCSRIMYKACRNRALQSREFTANKLISKTRWVVERTFGSLKLWFGSGVTRLKGLTKVHGWHTLEAIAHNLKRSHGLVTLMVK